MRVSFPIVFIRLSATSPYNTGTNSTRKRPVATYALDAGASSSAIPLDSNVAPTKNPDVCHVRDVFVRKPRIEANDTGTLVQSCPQNRVKPFGGTMEIILEVAGFLDHKDYFAVEFLAFVFLSPDLRTILRTIRSSGFHIFATFIRHDCLLVVNDLLYRNASLSPNVY
jgi:hypothetical protein